MEAVVNHHTGTVSVFENIEALSFAAAELFRSLSSDAIMSRGLFTVAVSGGSTPRRLFALLASGPYSSSIDWSRIHFFQVDERCVPPEHPDSNFRLINDLLLSRVPVPAGNIHRVKGEAGPEEAARDYENEIRISFRDSGTPVLDLIILGVGEDGHTASLFPGSETLRESTRIAVPVTRDRPELDRVTLSLRVIDRAAHVLFLASGRKKAMVIHHIVCAENTRGYPAGLVHPDTGTLQWFIDQEASKKVVEDATCTSRLAGQHTRKHI